MFDAESEINMLKSIVPFKSEIKAKDKGLRTCLCSYQRIRTEDLGLRNNLILYNLAQAVGGAQ